MAPFLSRLEKICNANGMGMEVFGSFATGLWVRQSNVDIQLTRLDIYDQNLSSKGMLENVYDHLKHVQGHRSLTIFNKIGRVGLVRVEIGDGVRSRSIHITVADRNQSNTAVVNFITKQLTAFPELRPMFFVLKALTCHYRLN